MLPIPLHPKLGNICRRVAEWQPYGTAFLNQRDAMQLAGHLLIFKHGTRVRAWGGLFHVEVWEIERHGMEGREYVD